MYTVGRRQLRLIGRWSKSLNLWFPNAHDKANDRTGSYILIHGGCSSIGCYALTDDVLDEVHGLVRQAIRRGRQRLVHVHAFPFRMTEANMTRHAGSVWGRFWRDLRVGYDLFERTRIPPQVGVCGTRYVFAEATMAQASRMAIRRVRANASTSDTVAPSRLICAPSPRDTETTTTNLEEVGVPRETALDLQ